MKRNTDFLSGISGLVAQIGIGYGMYVSYWAFHLHWNEILEGAKLPQITVLSFQWMRFVPAIAAVLLIAGFLIPVLRKRILWWTCGIVLLECLALTIVMMGLCFPALTITYKLAP
jgi:hypothetical protein